MFFGVGAKITNMSELETELNNLGFYFKGDSVVIGPVTFDFNSDWTDDFVQDISLVFRLEFDKILGKPDLSNNFHSINKIFINFEDIADEMLLLATTVYIMQNRANQLSSIVHSNSYNKNMAVSPPSPPAQTSFSYGNSNAPQASLTPATPTTSYTSPPKSSLKNNLQSYATKEAIADLEEAVKATPIVCDCGAAKVGTTHADWCSLKQ